MLNRAFFQARYLVFDGDVDAVWVENMNSVMDDNKLLTLPNGERIRLQNHCKLLFEVFDLQFASPATISRCGMVYVDSRNLGYTPYIKSWLSKWTPAEEQEQLHGLFEKYAVPAISWILEGVEGDELVKRPQQAVPITNLNMIRQLTTLLEILLHDQENDLQVLLQYHTPSHCTEVLNVMMRAGACVCRFLKLSLCSDLFGPVELCLCNDMNKKIVTDSTNLSKLYQA